MVHDVAFGVEFFAHLERQDRQIAERVAAEGCSACAGPLHRSDFERKPRGATIAPAGEESIKRFSLCCGREGCRKRVTPPSLRFLGRRAYLGIVVIVASLAGQATARAADLRRQTGVPPRTVRRWLSWWQGLFLGTEVFMAIRARLIGVSSAEVPSSIIEQLPGGSASRITLLLTWLAPLTTGSVPDGARFLRVVS